jgi:hypothetical protein
MTEEDVPSANDLPEFHGKRYNPGPAAASNMVCDYAYDTRCNITCLARNNELLQSKYYLFAKICFPTFDSVYGNCSLDHTMYEHSTVSNCRDSYNTRRELEEQVYR